MTTPDTAPAERDPRAPRPRGRVLRFTGLALLMAALGGWAVWMAVANTPDVDGILQRTTVHSDKAVTVYFEVAKDQQVPAQCTVRALGLEGFPVGSETVRIPAATERARMSQRLTTSKPAASTQVVNCHLLRTG